jgi:3-deoxy-D-manno-octulosonic-acid transferase
MSVAWIAYRAIAPVLGAIAPAARVFAAPAERPLWSERMGRVVVPEGCDAWVHAASLGEATAVRPLTRELLVLEPKARLHLTGTTRTGRARLASLGPGVSLAPIDAPQAVRRFFAGVNPGRVFIVETELWPHWLLAARARSVPVAMVSARLSERSVRRYRALGARLRALVGGLAAVLCQTDDDARRWLALGAPAGRTEVVGNLKNDALPVPAASRAGARASLGLDPERPLLVLGSVRPGELRVLARAWRALPRELGARWQVVAVPRHPGAAAELAAEARAEGQALIRDGWPQGGAWRWDDRIGVLADYYAAGEVAFVGGSLLPYGGHNPLEPAACGAAVVVGPHHDSQREAVRALEGAGAVRVAATEAALVTILGELLANAPARERVASAARGVVTESRGAARRAVARLAAWNLWPPG